MNRAIFLDRDGVLDELVFYPSSNEWEAPRTLDDLVMIDGITEPLRRFIDAGWLLFIVTNQPSYAKGKTTMEDTRAVHDAVVTQLGVAVTQSYICLHHPEAIVPELRIACECRKPGAQSLRDAARDFNVDLSKSWMIGDQDSDLLCGRAAGCRVALIENERSANKRGEVEPDLRVPSLAKFAQHFGVR
ncbi:MAG: HAD-IIIA family hydrolase [Acidobacteriota bacterium]|nr:HAD-IIIA family hydrolase [Acidobacteriota bacterium]